MNDNTKSEQTEIRKKNLLNRLIDAPFEFFGFLMFTPLWTKTPVYISVPLGFIQAGIVLYTIILINNSDKITTGMRVPLNGSGVFGGLLSIAIFPFFLGFIADFYFLLIALLICFYTYVTFKKLWTKKVR